MVSTATRRSVVCGIFLMLSLYWVSAEQDVASFAANTMDRVGSMSTVWFDTIIVNRNGFLAPGTWRLTIPKSGLYMVSLSAGHPGDGRTHYSLQRGNSRVTSIYRDLYDTHRWTVLGKDVILWLEKNEELFIRSEGPRVLSDMATLATSWGTFSLSDSMGTAVGFGAARSSAHGTGRVYFDTTWGNVGNAWSSSSSIFTAPTTGIYYFSFSTGVSSGQPVSLYLRVNGVNAYRIYRYENTPVNYDSLQRAVMLHLSQSDTVDLVSGHTGSSDFDYLTTFSGFLYNTSREYRQAWSVSHSNYIGGTTDPFPFEHIEVNEGGGWQNHEAVCLFTGLYFVHLSGQTYNGYYFQMTIMKGSRAEGGMRSDWPIVYETTSRSLIISCSQWETIRVVVGPGWIYSAPPDRDINFLGFYLFP